jgi:hypothetical protein
MTNQSISHFDLKDLPGLEKKSNNQNFEDGKRQEDFENGLLEKKVFGRLREKSNHQETFLESVVVKGE